MSPNSLWLKFFTKLDNSPSQTGFTFLGRYGEIPHMTSITPKRKAKRTYGGLSDDERKEERRERFLDAGLDIFGTLGIRGATVRTLCKTAALTERYFYESFANTDDLFCAVFERQLLSLHSLFKEKLPTLPADMEVRAQASLQLYFSAMKDERLVRILHIESQAGSHDILNMYNQHMRLLAEFAAQMIQAEHPGLKAPHSLTTQVALAIHGASSILAVQWMLGGYKIPQKTVVESCSLLVIGTIKELLLTHSR